MNFTIENEKLKLTFRSLGAELTSIYSKNNNIEYLWNGDPKYWSYHSPVLFPIVGKVKNNQYRVENKIYNIKPHGLARINDFQLYKLTDNSITFSLKYNDSMLQIYPYKFILKIAYTLNNNKIIVSYNIENADDKSIYFSIGAHPAFCCPLFKDECLEDYYIEFSEKEDLLQMIPGENGLFSHEEKIYSHNNDTIPLKADLLDDNTLIFKNLNSKYISIKSNTHSHSISVEISNFPYLGIWSKSAEAPFVCLEPWVGHSDYEDFSGDIKEKAGIIELNVGDTYTNKYEIIVN